MLETSYTLLEGVRSPEDEQAWERFYRTYADAILRYAQKLGMDACTAQDVLQESMLILMKRLRDFHYQPSKGRFRNYVFTIVHRTCLKHFRRKHPGISLDAPDHADARSMMDQVADPAQADVAEADLLQWRRRLLDQAMENLRHDHSLQASTIEVYEQFAIHGQPASVVSKRCGVKENAVYQIKHRLTERLRREVERIVLDGSGQR
jgi:RNA polymerase sigma-70 factor (ECF subfamily)